MNTQSSQWSVPKVSRLWSAKGDENCSPPRSDDYKDWSLMQLKREITKRQLKTNPRRRNKDAFVRVLLANDLDQSQTPRVSQNQTQQTLEESAIFVPSSELHGIYDGDQAPQQEQKDVYATQQQSQQNIYRSSGGQQQLQQDVYGTNVLQQPQPQHSELYNGQQQRQNLYMEHSHQQDVYTNAGEQSQTFISNEMNSKMLQPASLTPLAQTPTQSSVEVTVVSTNPDAEKKSSEKYMTFKRQRIEQTEHRKEESENAQNAKLDMGKTTLFSHQGNKGSTEYLRRKLSIQAAHVEIKSRRLDIEIKREQRKSELHAVQLALAKEQLQQAKLSSQKMKSEWVVEQLIHKKRLNDAGISQEDSAALGMYLS
ncbi:uncharacterized protein PHALS_13448 [Plasmopara halstedii]|uniref:Uncharacterized protein n=1 Tax=Plasmopara halstedii TaxID=4781 RepID=A0A0P1APP2_PLAHL|nr:uncharacterized protein PHALS_13448 [Plasmopara halstedii]CEG43237.1 hypothetical protein PHALS_13448 [Plasmopara halstedii]|eukprot:XP_024579606.1 hypothetical protein PHALS_13448 [Plasmopara halstedii]